MIEILTSDPAILVLASVGLVATGVSILRDARSQRRILAPQLTVVSQNAEIAGETRIAA